MRYKPIIYKVSLKLHNGALPKTFCIDTETLFFSTVIKMSILPFSQKFLFLSFQMELEIMFHDHLVREKALLDYKNIRFTQWQHCIFPKGVNL